MEGGEGGKSKEKGRSCAVSANNNNKRHYNKKDIITSNYKHMSELDSKNLDPPTGESLPV